MFDKKHHINIKYDDNIKEVNIKTANDNNISNPIATPSTNSTNPTALNTILAAGITEQQRLTKLKQYKNDRWISFGTFIMVVLFVVASVFYFAELNPTLNIFNLSIIHFDLSKSYFLQHPQTVNWLGYIILVWGVLTVICGISSTMYLRRRGYNTYYKTSLILSLFLLIYVAFIYYIFIDAAIVAKSSDLATAIASYNVHIPYLKSIKILLEVIAGYSLALMIAYLLISMLDYAKMHKQVKRNGILL